MFIVDVVVELIGYQTARMLLPVLSAGWIRAADLTSDQPGGWAGCYRDAERRLVFTPDMAGWIGILMWLLTLVLVIVATGR
ncbi:hypothetical protein [Aureimonas jatrophae]|uniref:Uncharacterized protein n=1 Tax=Aureimonas jatrophae TaxID=1166073 RepID=A0A1H0M6K7_9HYPH|nr:hypothetical protein [Aureimonas jatrophae]MBB3952599.1 hypothetical protein [Aureimonas jatrophae]SDO75997.1 hypothetical protein SAMN05192530_11291 [Aureimonas jatrophae]